MAARLDLQRLYGIWWYNRRQVQRTRVLKDSSDGERRYVTRTRTADAMALDELRSKLNSLEETRETARRELATLASWNESLEVFERDKDKLLESYATLAPEALAALDSEERRAVYSMLGLCVEALPDKSLRGRGAFGEENLVWEKERTSTR